MTSVAEVDAFQDTRAQGDDQGRSFDTREGVASQVGVVFADYYPYPLNLLLRGGAGRPLNPLFISS